MRRLPLDWVTEGPPLERDRECPGSAEDSRILSEEITDTSNLACLCNRAVALVYEFVTPASDFWNEFEEVAPMPAPWSYSMPGAYVKNGETTKERLERACFLAAATNMAPICRPRRPIPSRIGSIMEGRLAPPVVVGDVYETVREASVLYVTDNAGEIGFDSLVIDMIKEMGARVTLVVKENVFFEDATLEDARFLRPRGKSGQVVTADKVFVPDWERRGLGRLSGERPGRRQGHGEL